MNKKSYAIAMLLVSSFVVSSHTYAKSAAGMHAQQVKNTASINEETLSKQDEPNSRPKVNKVSFTGNTAISSAELIKKIPLKTQDIANEYVIMDSLVKIAQLYKLKHIKVTITPILQKSSPHYTNIQFDIHEISNQNK